jgi:proline dehydrogenase
MVRRSWVFRPLVRRFIAGDTLEEALENCRPLLEQGLKVSLDYLGENTKSEAEAIQAKATYIQMLEEISKVAPKTQEDDVEPLNISIKLTQCGLDLGDEFAERNYREVLEAARRLNNFVRVDMEGSQYTERTIQMMERVAPEYQNTGTVLQSYLFRTDDDLERLLKLGLRVRLVKGAYLEPGSIAYPEKEKVDAAYLRQAETLLERGTYPAIATHDEKIIRHVCRFAKDRGIAPSRFEFQMLYGIRRDLQQKLHEQGYNVRVYVPFGDSWYPYFTRRLAERPANGIFILKSLFRG